MTNHKYYADVIAGASSSPPPPVETPDNLKSISYAKVLDLLCEGEIEGLVNGGKSIYLNDTPLENPDGTFSYENVYWETREGTQAQTPMDAFGSVEATVTLNVEIKKANPYTFNITNETVDKVRIAFALPQMVHQEDDGDLLGSSVTYNITYFRDESQVESTNYTVTGKTTSKYVFTKDVSLIRTAPSNDFRFVVSRVSADSTSSKYQNDIYIESYTSIVSSKLSYPNSALVGISIDSANFSSIPSRGYHVKLLRIRIPSNYDPITRLYNRSSSTGLPVTDGNGSPVEQLWNGTFYIAWSNNPAWCLYDLITSGRYGLGDYIPPEYVDKWSLYSIGRYCDTLVPDGRGAYEPRFTLNTYIQTREDAIKVVQNIASAFRGMVYWAAGTITAVQDSSGIDPSIQFNNSNVIDGIFNYSSASNKVVHNAAIVTWNDPNLNYRQRLEYVEDREAIEKYGYNPSEFIAFGTTSRGQAHRAGKWLLYTEKVESSVVTFKAALDAFSVRPGTLIKVHDDLRNGQYKYILGGRVLSRVDNQLHLDKSVTYDPAKLYSIRLTNYSTASGTYNITTSSSAQVLTLSTDVISTLLFKDTIWILKDATNTVVDRGTIGFFDTTKIIDLGKVVTITGAGYTLYLERVIVNTVKYDVTPQLTLDASLSQVFDTVDIDTAVDTDIGPNTIWSILPRFGSTAEALFKVLSIKETDSLGIYDILAVKHDRFKYDYVENEKDLLDTDDYSTFGALPKQLNINTISMYDSIYLNSAGQLQTQLSIGFGSALYAASYDIYIQKDNTPWRLINGTYSYSEITEYNVIDNSYYRVKIVPINILGKKGPATIYPPLDEIGYKVLGKARPPANVTNITLSNQGDYLRIDWDPVADLDLKHYQVRYATTDEMWDTATILSNVKADVYDAIPSVYQAPYSLSTVDSVDQLANSPISTTGLSINAAALSTTDTDIVATDSINRNTTGAIDRNSTIRYFIKAVDTSGNKSVLASYIDFKVQRPGTPIVTNTLIGNTVQLSWTASKTTFNIVKYNIYRGDLDTLVGETSVTNYSTYINWVGDGVFYVEAVDAGGNRSLPSLASVVHIEPPVFLQEIEFSVTDANLRIEWKTEAGTLPIKEVQIQYGGTTWNVGTTAVGTTSASYILVPINWLGKRSFMARVYDIVGNSDTSTATFEVLAPATPIVNDAVFSKLDNSLILSWQDCKTTLPIDYYEVREGFEWNTATPVCKIYSLETTIPINWTDNEGLYLVKAVDVNGNESPITLKVVTIVFYGPVAGFNYKYSDSQLNLSWNAPLIQGSMGLDRYEIWSGSTTELGAKVASSTFTTVSIPVDWNTSKIFWVIPIDMKGNVGEAAYVEVQRLHHGAITNPVTAVKGSNLEFSWDESTSGSLPIKYYIISIGLDYPTSIELAKVTATNYSHPVDFIADTAFWITPVDTNPVGEFTLGTPTLLGLTNITKTPAPIIDYSEIISAKVELSWHAQPHLLPISYYSVVVQGVEYTTTTSNTVRVPIPFNYTGILDIKIIAVDTNLIGNGSNISDPTDASKTISAPVAPVINTVTSGFNAENYIIHWSEVINPIPIEDYEIGTGGTVLARQKTNTFSAIAQWSGDKSFWVRAVDILGNSGAQAVINLTVTNPGAVSSFSGQVIDNNVLLYWGITTGTLPIKTYEIQQGAYWGKKDKVIGTKSGNFTSLFETEANIYTYWIAAIDSAGNIGTPKAVVLEVSQPPDYILKGNDYTNLSTVTNPVNVVLDPSGHLIMPIDSGETFSGHFEARLWTNPNDQVADGFNLFIQPTVTSASFENTINYGTVLSSIKVNILPQYTIIGGLPNLTCDIYTSPTGLTGSWQPYLNTWTVLADNFQFVKYVITATSAKEATYTQSGSTISINLGLHGLANGSTIYADFITGAAAGVDEGQYVISVQDNSNFNITVASSRVAAIASGVRLYPINTTSGLADAGIIDLASVNVKLDAKLRTLTGSVRCTAPILAANYEQTGYNMIVSYTNHNIQVGDIVDLDIATGTATDLIAVVTVADTNSFQCTSLVNEATPVTGTLNINSNGNYVYMTKDRIPSSPNEFIDIDAISLSPNSTTASIAVYDFLDQPNPTYFKVLIFNTAGQRLPGTCSYTVRGF